MSEPSAGGLRAEAPSSPPAIVVAIPCFNEAPSIERVVAAFRRELPAATILVVDNHSSDETAARARAAGAEIISERKQGKGHAVRAVFQRVDADFYVLVDGDGTYEPASVHALLAPVLAGEADMAVGRRVAGDPRTAWRPMHVFGNGLVNRLIHTLFGARLTDIMSGYRAFSREVVRRTPLVSRGFEIETELTVQALAADLVIVEQETPYYARLPDSPSKLRTFRDGTRILWTILSLFMAFKPLTFFGAIGLSAAATGLSLLRPVPRAGLLFVLGGLGLILLGLVLTNINNRVMALMSLMTRGRLAERDNRCVVDPRAKDSTQQSAKRL